MNSKKLVSGRCSRDHAITQITLDMRTRRVTYTARKIVTMGADISYTSLSSSSPQRVEDGMRQQLSLFLAALPPCLRLFHPLMIRMLGNATGGGPYEYHNDGRA